MIIILICMSNESLPVIGFYFSKVLDALGDVIGFFTFNILRFMLDVTFSQVVNHLTELISYFVNPSKRIFWLYLATSMLLVWVWIYVKKQSLSEVTRKSFSRRYWFNPSSLLDVKWITVNQLLALFFILPVLMGQVSVAMSVYRSLVSTFGDGDFLHWDSGLVMAMFTLAVFLVEDFTRFFVHFCYHKVPLLWRFHAIHHSALTMSPLTLYRVHFVEYFINACRSLFMTGAVSGLFMYLFVGAISVYEVLGVSILNMLFNLAGSNLRHSHIKIGFGKFENVFISPAQHQIHHSSAKAHLDKNFGATLSIWDKMFGSFVASNDQKVFRYGLYRTKTQQTLFSQLLGISPKTN